MATAIKEDKKTEVPKANINNRTNTAVTKKKCFIITPIGSDNSDIRRQIDGVIDACIIPALDDFEVSVSHRISTPGSINNQIISHIYQDDLVIANLTSLNPNVMYELAFRHAIRKPIIVIKNKNDGCNLPFDIKDDRTIFYNNDIKGTLELKEELEKYLKDIDYGTPSDNPISRAIKDYEARELIDEIERKLDTKKIEQDSFIEFHSDEIVDPQLEELYLRLNYVQNKLICCDKVDLDRLRDALFNINHSYMKIRPRLKSRVRKEFEEAFMRTENIINEFK